MSGLLPEDRLQRIRDLANGLRLPGPPEAAPEAAASESHVAAPQVSPEERLDQARELAGLPPLPKPEPQILPVFSMLTPSAQYQENLDVTRRHRARVREDARREATLVEWQTILDQRAAAAEAVEEAWKGRRRNSRKLAGGHLLVQISDVHFGASSRSVGNVFDLEVAAQRLAAYAAEVIAHAGAFQIPSLTIAFTGDMFDSKIGKGRHDKQVQAPEPAAATYVRGRDLIFQFVDELIEDSGCGYVRLVGIVGNEARLTFECNHADRAAVESWDAILNSDLASRYGSRVECEFGVSQHLFEIEGFNCLAKHGHQGIPKDLDQKAIQSVLYTHGGDFGISGHIHDPMVTGRWCRSGSLMGTDSFAGNTLNLSGYASQTFFHIRPGVRNVHVVDLDNCEGVEPYVITPHYYGAFGEGETRFTLEG